MIRTLVGALVPDRPDRGIAETPATDPRELPVEPDDYLDVDTALTLLANGRRRHIIDAVAEAPALARPLVLTDLAVDVADREGSNQKAAYVALRQCHLDRLDEADVLAVDWEENTIRRGPMFDQARAPLENIRRRFGEPLDAHTGGER